MTGLATPAEMAEARRLGVAEIIEKPGEACHRSGWRSSDSRSHPRSM
jgi:hypothetical protein